MSDDGGEIPDGLAAYAKALQRCSKPAEPINDGELQEVRGYVERAIRLRELHNLLLNGQSTARLIARLDAAESRNRILEKKNESSLANNLCPDHRDKQGGRECLACLLEKAESRAAELQQEVERLRNELCERNEMICQGCRGSEMDEQEDGSAICEECGFHATMNQSIGVEPC